MRNAAIVGLIVLSALVCCSQTQKAQPGAQSTNCPETHLRFTVRGHDELPVADLKPSDIQVWFDGSVTRVVSLQNSIGSRAGTPDTDLLFVVPPYFRLNKYSIARLITHIRNADNFHIVAAVLEADGSVSTFSDEPKKLESALSRAISAHLRHSSRSKWSWAEETAFQKLHDLPERHVVVDLQDPANPFRSPVKGSFIADRTMERLALFDGAQVYRLVESVPISASIPSGDASAIHSDIGLENHGAEQLQQVQAAATEQSNVWMLENGNFTGGRSGETLDAVFDEVLEDAGGSYDAVIQPTRECVADELYSVNISSRIAGVRLFGPNEVQEIPANEKTH